MLSLGGLRRWASINYLRELCTGVMVGCVPDVVKGRPCYSRKLLVNSFSFYSTWLWQSLSTIAITTTIKVIMIITLILIIINSSSKKHYKDRCKRLLLPGMWGEKETSLLLITESYVCLWSSFQIFGGKETYYVKLKRRFFTRNTCARKTEMVLP